MRIKKYPPAGCGDWGSSSCSSAKKVQIAYKTASQPLYFPVITANRQLRTRVTSELLYNQIDETI